MSNEIPHLLGLPIMTYPTGPSSLSARLEKSTKWIKEGEGMSRCTISDNDGTLCLMVAREVGGRLLFLGTERVWKTDWKECHPFADKDELTTFFTSRCAELRGESTGHSF